MTTIEALRVFSTEHDQVRDQLECGLIYPDKMAEYQCASLEEYDLQKFDELSELANGGLIYYDNRYFRIDDRLENGNMIRSVLELKNEDENGNTNGVVSSHIAHRDGNNYFEIHPCIIQPCGTIWEPEPGDELIRPAESYREVILHGLLANDGIALPQAA